MRSPSTVKHLEVKNLVALIFCCCLALFIGFTLTGQYLSRNDMEKNQIDALRQSLEKRAFAVSYYFSERFSDLENLGGTRELNGYFENMALGMSMKYGLKSSIFHAARRFRLLMGSKTIGKDPIYSRIVFITKNEQVLIDTMGVPNSFPGGLSHLIRAGEKPRQIIENESGILVSQPFYFKSAYFGQLVAFLNPETIERHLVHQTSESGGFYGMVAGTGPLRLPNDMVLDLPGQEGIDLEGFKGDQVLVFKGRWNKVESSRIIAMRTQVVDTPFSIVSLSQSRAMSGKSIFATMTAVALFLMMGIFLIWRTATQRLILGVRLSESRESEKRFRNLVEFLPVPIVEYGFDLKLRYANKEAFLFMGYTRAEVDRGIKITDIVEESDYFRAMDHIRALKNEKNPGPIEICLKPVDKGKIWGMAIPSLVYENNICTGVRTCFIDMTQRRETEKESIRMAEQEKFALVGQVAGKMAHDFNNILGAIMGNAEFSLMDCHDDEIRQTLEIILDQTKRGKILTQNLVAFAKDQEIKEEYFNINEKIDLVFILLKKELQGIRIIKEYEEEPPELLADPGMIEHTLVNLVQNAVHAMGKTQDPELRVETGSKGSELTIRIKDNGCGIPRDQTEEVFSPSFTLKGSRDVTHAYPSEVKGTGYGLSNVKKYIDKHRGKIEFLTQENQGSEFVITLPLTAKGLLFEEKQALEKKPVIQRKHILLVEDEAAISMVLGKVLTSAPFFHTVKKAGDAALAMELADSESFDLVSLDYMLPGRINGLDVYTHIRETSKALPVIFISGNIRFLESMDRLKAKDPYLDHLSKPFDNLAYAYKINDWLQHDELIFTDNQ